VLMTTVIKNVAQKSIIVVLPVTGGADHLSVLLAVGVTVKLSPQSVSLTVGVVGAVVFSSSPVLIDTRFAGDSEGEYNGDQDKLRCHGH
jgi:hypothetical protein